VSEETEVQDPNRYWHPKQGWLTSHFKIIPREEYQPTIERLGTETELMFRKPYSFAEAPEAREIFKEDWEEKSISHEAAASVIELMTFPQPNVGALAQNQYVLMSKAVAWAEAHDLRILPVACEPLHYSMQPDWDWYYMKNLVEKYGAGAQRICGMTGSVQLNLQIESGDAALFCHEGWTRAMPIMIALSASSPFHQGLPTGLLSFRTLVRGLYLNGGPVPEPIPAGTTWAEYHEMSKKLMKMQEVCKAPFDHNLPLRLRLDRGCLEVGIMDMIADHGQYRALIDLCRRLTWQMLVCYKEGRQLPAFLGTSYNRALRHNLKRSAMHGRNGTMHDANLDILSIRQAIESTITWAAQAPADPTQGWSETEKVLAHILENGNSAEQMMQSFRGYHPYCPDPMRGCPNCKDAVRSVCEEVSRLFHIQYHADAQEFREPCNKPSVSTGAGDQAVAE